MDAIATSFVYEINITKLLDARAISYSVVCVTIRTISRLSYNLFAMAEKRKQWRKNDGKGVKRSNLREIRKVPKEESESEDEFVGFKYIDTEQNKDKTRKSMSILHRAQGYVDEFNLAGPSSSGVVPKPVPLETGDQEFVEVSTENHPLHSEFPQEILWMIPSPREGSSDENNPNEISYYLREAGTQKGNPCIETSDGHTFSHHMNSGKKGDKNPKFVYFKCIKRQWKNENNCGARLKITNYELGENGWKVEPLGRKDNHDQG